MGTLKRRGTVQSSGRAPGGRAPAWHPERGSISLCLDESRKVPREEFDVAALGAVSLSLAFSHFVALTHLDNSSPHPGSEACGINGGPSCMSPKAQHSGETSVPLPPAVGWMYHPHSPKSAAPAPVSASCPKLPISSAVPISSASFPVTSSVLDSGVSSISPASPNISLDPTDVKELSTKEPGSTLELQELAWIAEKVPGLQNKSLGPSLSSSSAAPLRTTWILFSRDLKGGSQRKGEGG
ncbi:Ataxin-2-like protein [Plecturocebus cupreus]